MVGEQRENLAKLLITDCILKFAGAQGVSTKVGADVVQLCPPHSYDKAPIAKYLVTTL